jgi:hypothetical protein
LSDRSADGWAYSTQFAQFGSITETMVRQALPAASDASVAAAVASFLARFKAEERRLKLRYPDPWQVPF